MRNKVHITVIVILLGLLTHCTRNEPAREIQKRISTLLDETQLKYAPDRRTEIFEIEAIYDSNEGWQLKGETTSEIGKKYLLNHLSEYNISFNDSIYILPDTSVKHLPMALVNVSVANLRMEPSHRAEMATQAILGTPLRIIKNEGAWLLVQTPDKYIAWVTFGGITLVTKEQLEEYLHQPRIIFTDTEGYAFRLKSGKKEIISDLVAGSVLELIETGNGLDHVRYPDGRQALIDTKYTKSFDSWKLNSEASMENLIRFSYGLIGRPYLWGGTSTKALDCSGFTKTVYFMNGVLLPRDASQQINEGILIDTTRNFENLMPGDLLFFGRKITSTSPEKIVHVAMWIGHGKFIHSSGDVNIRSMVKSDTLFDAYNYNRYLRTKRLISQNEFPLTYVKDLSIH